jgi:hypothetical protein
VISASGETTPSPTLSPAQSHADLLFLSTQLAKRHANAFHHISREAFHSEVNRLDAQLATLAPDEIFARMDQIVNSIGDGHTYLRVPADAPKFPLEFEPFGDDYRLTAAAPSAHAQAVLGGKLVAVDGTPFSQVLERLLTLTPADETQPLRILRAASLLNSGLVLHGLHIAHDRDRVHYTFETEGKETTLEVASDPANPAPDWLHAAAIIPLYRQHPDRSLWCVYLAQEKAEYCAFQSYRDLAESSKALFDLLREKQAQYLIIDLRLNKGGDFDLGLKYLINPISKLHGINQTGHLFVLIGPRTFSAAMSNAAQFRERTKAMLVGQPIGEKPNSYQEARDMSLPNSHWTIHYSVRFYRFTRGKENLIRPDKEVPETWDDYRAGRDPVLDWVLRKCAPAHRQTDAAA